MKDSCHHDGGRWNRGEQGGHRHGELHIEVAGVLEGGKKQERSRKNQEQKFTRRKPGGS